MRHLAGWQSCAPAGFKEKKKKSQFALNEKSQSLPHRQRRHDIESNPA